MSDGDMFHVKLVVSEELEIRSEEWWKGRTKFGSAPIPFFYKVGS